MTTWFCTQSCPRQVTEARLSTCLSRPSDRSLSEIGWSRCCGPVWKCFLLGGPGFFHISTVSVLFYLWKWGLCLEPGSWQHSLTENRLGVGVYATISVKVGERRKRCFGLISQIYFLEIWIGIGTAKPRFALCFLIGKRCRRQGPRFPDKPQVLWWQVCSSN